jgi:hypothetical protein
MLSREPLWLGPADQVQLRSSQPVADVVVAFVAAARNAFVHHTDNPNGYAAADVPAMRLAIYLI